MSVQNLAGSATPSLHMFAPASSASAAAIAFANAGAGIKIHSPDDDAGDPGAAITPLVNAASAQPQVFGPDDSSAAPAPGGAKQGASGGADQAGAAGGDLGKLILGLVQGLMQAASKVAPMAGA